MRRDGSSLRAISRALDVSKASVSVWVRDVPRGGRPADFVIRPEATKSTEPISRRRCGRCRKRLPLSEFNRSGSGHQWWCRECFRVYFRERGALHRQQCSDSRRKRQARAKALVREHLASHPCVDCAESDPQILEFDHLGQKVREISLMAAEGASVQVLQAEIAKCAVVCVNCHRRRTARRANWRRATKDWWKSPPPGDHLQSRNIAYAYSYLELHPCVDCGCSDLCVLEFDHVGEKAGTVLAMARNGVSLERLIREIEACEVRCANCHRRKTAARRRGLGRS
jgi:hypothetical protein